MVLGVICECIQSVVERFDYNTDLRMGLIERHAMIGLARGCWNVLPTLVKPPVQNAQVD